MMKLQYGASVAIAALMLGIGAAPAMAQNIISVDLPAPFGGLDPAKISDQIDYTAAVNLYDALLTVVEGGALQGELAESWEVSDDAREVTFKIRDDANFTDGSPVEASDVVYSFERLLRINQGPANLFSGLLDEGSVTAVDNKTVKFVLNKTYAPFLTTVPSLFILNEELVRANDNGDDGQEWLSTNAAGGGAYVIKEGPNGTGFTIARDENYYAGFNENPIDEVRWVVVGDEATVRSMAASGELSFASTFLSPTTFDALAAMDRFNVEDTETATAYMLKLNSQTAPTDDVHIRRAIALATDYETIREVIYPGVQLNGPLPSAFGDAVASDLPEPVYDLEAAAAEVAKSKYAGQPVPITLGYLSGYKFQEDISLLLQANLESIGFVVTQQADTWARLTELASTPETTPAVNHIFFGPTYPSPDSMFFTQYHSASAGTWASMEWIADPEIDGWIDAARGTGDVAEQNRLYQDIQRKLVAEQSDVYLVTLTAKIAMDKCLTGYTFVPMQSVPYDFTRYSWLCD